MGSTDTKNGTSRRLLRAAFLPVAVMGAMVTSSFAGEREACAGWSTVASSVAKYFVENALTCATNGTKDFGCGSPTPHVSPYFTTRSRGLAGHSGAGTCLLA
jgi:hypothetical protein